MENVKWNNDAFPENADIVMPYLMSTSSDRGIAENFSTSGIGGIILEFIGKFQNWKYAVNINTFSVLEEYEWILFYFQGKVKKIKKDENDYMCVNLALTDLQ